MNNYSKVISIKFLNMFYGIPVDLSYFPSLKKWVFTVHVVVVQQKHVNKAKKTLVDLWREIREAQKLANINQHNKAYLSTGHSFYYSLKKNTSLRFPSHSR